MSLTLHYHPLSSFCWKALIGLYELEIPFEKHLVDLSDPAARAAFANLWPIAKFPVLVTTRGVAPYPSRPSSWSTWTGWRRDGDG
jgi:glutathione S-transferase